MCRLQLVCYLSEGLSQGRERSRVALYEGDLVHVVRPPGQTGHHGEGILQQTTALSSLSLVLDQLLSTGIQIISPHLSEKHCPIKTYLPSQVFN